MNATREVAQVGDHQRAVHPPMRRGAHAVGGEEQEAPNLWNILAQMDAPSPAHHAISGNEEHARFTVVHGEEDLQFAAFECVGHSPVSLNSAGSATGGGELRVKPGHRDQTNLSNSRSRRIAVTDQTAGFLFSAAQLLLPKPAQPRALPLPLGWWLWPPTLPPGGGVAQMGVAHHHGNRHIAPPIHQRLGQSFMPFARAIADPARNAVSVNKTWSCPNAPSRQDTHAGRRRPRTPANAHAQGRCQACRTGGRLVVIVPVASAAMVLSVLS